MSENHQTFDYYSTFRFNSVIIFFNDCESVYLNDSSRNGTETTAAEIG